MLICVVVGAAALVGDGDRTDCKTDDGDDYKRSGETEMATFINSYCHDSLVPYTVSRKSAGESFIGWQNQGSSRAMTTTAAPVGENAEQEIELHEEDRRHCPARMRVVRCVF